MTRSEAANKALGALKPARLDTPKRIPLWNERVHSVQSTSPFLHQSSKGGPGSGNFGHGGLEGVHGGSGDEPDSGTSRDSPAKKPDIGKIAKGRVQFQKNRLAREIVASAARVKELEEKPFRTPKDRLEARKHLKQMRKKLEDLDMDEAQVWEVIDQFPIEEQAYLASMASLDTKDSRAKKIVKNVSSHLLKQKIQDIGSKFAPSPTLEPEQVKKLGIAETTAYLAAYDDPTRATNFLRSLETGDFQKANRIRQQGLQNIISNTQRNKRNRNWLETAGELHAQYRVAKERNPEVRFPTQQEFNKLVSERLRQKGESDLAGHRETYGNPFIRFGGFGERTAEEQ